MIELGPSGVAAAFAAGFVSFSSPRVLPLVPGYLSFVSGVSFDELGARPRRVTASTAAFIAGFTAMFVALGAGAAWFGSFLLENRRTLEIVAGVFVLLAAVTLAGLPLPRLLAAERRVPFPRGGGLATACLTGIAFAVAWTPCVGPTLAAILTLSVGASPGEGAVLLAAFSLGLGLPFCSSALPSHGRSAWFAGPAIAGGRSASARRPCSPSSECCSSPASSSS